jgi:amphi-Trp domain-containing protein
MPKVEIERTLTLSRREVSDRLVQLGRALADGPEIELSSSGDKLKLTVGSKIEWELEIEIDGDQTELEIELKWRDDPEAEDGEAPVGDTARPSTRRGRGRKSST